MTPRLPTPTQAAMRRVVSAIAVLGALLQSPAAAQVSRDLECIQQYNAAVAGTARQPLSDANPANGCRRVAVAVAADWDTRALFGTAVDARDVAATRDQTTASPGDASAPIEPVEAAGGSLAAVGTDRGAGAVAAIAINPSIFFVDPSNTEQVARWSRFTDVTLLVPASDLGEDDGDGGEADDDEGMDYVGIRWGLNFTGLERGSKLHQAVVDAYNRFLRAGTGRTQVIRDLLLALPSENLEACVRVLTQAQSLDADATRQMTQTCGGAPVATDPAIIAGLREEIEKARVQADSRYFGLDLRADFGNLTLAGVDTVSGTSIFAGVGWGRRSVRNTEAATGVRAHGGVRYWDNEGADEDENVAVEGGIAFEAIRFYNFQRLTAVGGLDLQYRTGGVDDGEEETSINLRGSLNIPITGTASVSVNLAAPVKGERRGPVLSIKGNWRLLRSGSF